MTPVMYHSLQCFDTFWGIMLGQAECTKPADRQLIQTGTNDEWHFKQSAGAANSSFFPGVPSCSMLLMNSYVHSLYQGVVVFNQYACSDISCSMCGV